jgi:hypothetical protein
MRFLFLGLHGRERPPSQRSRFWGAGGEHT